MRTAIVCLLLTACICVAAPPKPEADVVKAEIGKDTQVFIRSTGGAKFTAAPGFGKDECLWFAGERTEDGQVFLVRPYYEDRKFRVLLWSEGDKRNEYSTLEIDPTPGTTAPPPKKKDPVTPVPTGKYYFLIVRPDGPADPAFTRIMANEGWKTLVANGHTYKDKTVTEAKRLGIPVETLTSPTVYILDTSSGKSVLVGGPVSLPATTFGIIALPLEVR